MSGERASCACEASRWLILMLLGMYALGLQVAQAQGRTCDELRREFLELFKDPATIADTLIIKVRPDQNGNVAAALGVSQRLVSLEAVGAEVGRIAASDSQASGEHLSSTGVTVSKLSRKIDPSDFLNSPAITEEVCQSIEYIEPDRIVKKSGDEPPELHELLYGLKNTGVDGGIVDADVDAPEAWQLLSQPEEVVVGIVDSGIDYRHPDLRANMFRNPFEQINGLDDDGNGYIDDIHGIARTCNKPGIFGSCSGGAINSGDPMDENGHGTHVAGTVAGEANGFGVVGVARNVKLLGLRFLNYEGVGSYSDAIRVVDYAIALKSKGINIRVLNNSWGSDSRCSTSLKDLVARTTKAGILFVAAAGNSSKNIDSIGSSPADCPEVLAVAATTPKGQLASFSNYGATKVHVAAPGLNIYSTWPPSVDPFRRYHSISGTSMAAPHVSGVAALVFGAKTKLSPAEMRSLLMQTAKPYAALQGKVVSGGIVSAKNALAQ